MGNGTQMIGVVQKTYPQQWPAYNAAQVAEKEKFLVLLHDLCAGLASPEPKVGRPRLPLADAIFAATFKVYSTFSGRRFMSDLRAAQQQGLLSRLPHFNSIFNVLRNEDITDVLISLIELTSTPLADFEDTFAVDSTGFSSTKLTLPSLHQHKRIGRPPKYDFGQHDWVKCHLAAGVSTNIVTAVYIGGRTDADSPQLPGLVRATAKRFLVKKVVADKAYSGKVNTEFVGSLDAVPYLRFKDNAVGNGGPMWRKMYHLFKSNEQEYFDQYHKRSNVESTFSMMKRKFEFGIRSRKETSMKNEVLCKVLCHNLVVLVHSMYELGIDPVFWTRPPKRSPDLQRVF